MEKNLFDSRLDSSLPSDTMTIHDQLVWGDEKSYQTIKAHAVDPILENMKEKCLQKAPELYDDFCTHTDGLEQSISDFQKQENILSHHPKTWDNFILHERKNLVSGYMDYLVNDAAGKDTSVLKEHLKYFMQACDSSKDLFQKDTQALARKTLQYRKQVEDLMNQTSKLDEISKKYQNLYQDPDVQKNIKKIKDNCRSIIRDTAEVYQNTQDDKDKHPSLSHRYMQETEQQVKDASRTMKAGFALLKAAHAEKEISLHTSGYLARKTGSIKEKMQELVKGIRRNLKQSLTAFRSSKGKPNKLDIENVKEFWADEAASRLRLRKQTPEEIQKFIKQFSKSLEKVADKQNFIETTKSR